LPHMTTGQRKQAKKFVDKFPELACESFGFGPERQLHVFKKACTENIADKRQERRSAAKTETQVAAEKTEDMAGSPRMHRTSSVSTSDSVSSPSKESSPASSGRDSPSRELPPTEGIQVRNTFIHIEDASAAEGFQLRVIQSMPHGMFGQQLLAETTPGSQQGLASVASEAPSCPATAAEVAPVAFTAASLLAAGGAPIAIGAEVVIEGLTKCPAFNGLAGRVQSVDEQTGRYNILMIGGQVAKVKAENLRLGSPIPLPCFPPYLGVNDYASTGLLPPYMPAPGDGFLAAPFMPRGEEGVLAAR